VPVRDHVALWVGVFVIVMLGAMLYRIDRNTREGVTPELLREIVREELRKEDESMLVARWTDEDGIEREVRTSKGEPGNEKETEEEFQDRHDARVQEQLERYPMMK
jgi:hypothetical protein